MQRNNRVVVGMSGGVDSTVAAYRLKEMGYDVIGVNMRLWQDPHLEYEHMMTDGGCCSLSSVEDARRVCAAMSIPFYALDFKGVFKETVVDYFIDAYQRGETPNPCIACNKHVKFDALLEKAHQLGAYYVATGHYASIVYDAETDHYAIERSKADRKDQTYALYNLTQAQLKHILMPLSDFESKEAVREIAAQFDVQMSRKSDSQEICFIPDQDYVGFLERNTSPEALPPEGEFVDTEGTVLGSHRGITHYTVGQRKGLGMTFGKPMYVIDVNPQTHQVTLGDGKDVFSRELWAREANFIEPLEVGASMTCDAKIRYGANPASCVVTRVEDTVFQLVFDTPQRAVTPGQAVVLYKGNRLLGGGTIFRK